VKKTIDIEKLLQWAVREELPKGQAIGASSWDIVSQYAALGVRVDVSRGGGDGLGFLAGDPHPDAILVADAVREITERAKFDHVVEVLPLFGDLAPIAGAAVDAIMCATFNSQAIVISKATLGTRPRWQFDMPTPAQMFFEARNSRDELRTYPIVHGIDDAGDVVMMKKNRGRALKRDGEYNPAMAPRSPIEWCDPSPLAIGDARAEYVAWHMALSQLALDLNGKLCDFAVTPPAVSLMPWLDTPLVSRVIFRDAFARYAAHGLPLQPRRKAAGPPVESPIEAESVASYNRASREKMRKTPTIAA
jgi:hypothetical protein